MSRHRHRFEAYLDKVFGFSDLVSALPEGRQFPQHSSRVLSTTGCVDRSSSRFRITHPFHPLRGTEYELVHRRKNWGQDRVFFYGADGSLKSFLANVTDVLPMDEFTRISGGRSAFRVDDLLALRQLLDGDNRGSGGKQDV